MKKISLKLKITLWYVVAMLMVVSVVLFAMLSVSSKIIDKEVTERLVRTVTISTRQLRTPFGDGIDIKHFRFYDQGVHMALFDAEYNLISEQTPFSIPEDKLEFEDNVIKTLTYDGDSYYSYDRSITTKDGKSYWLKGIISITNENNVINSMAKLNVLLALIFIVCAAVGGYFIIDRTFKPVNKISRTAEEIAQSGDFSKRIGMEGGSDELSGLANTFDNMLDKLEQTYEREKQFTSDASHELRTPVAVIVSECEYMLDCAKKVDEYRDCAVSVKKQADKMSKLISELLMISRMDRNSKLSEYEQVNLSEMLGFVCDEQQEIQTKDIRLEKNISDNVYAVCDKLLIMRLFINLISNAYQYTDDGGTIIVSLSGDDKQIVFSVEDNGIGISQKDITEIWERFYQVDVSRNDKDGSGIGIGLSMVKQIARLHGGKVDVQSELGKGSKFTFAMPLK